MHTEEMAVIGLGAKRQADVGWQEIWSSMQELGLILQSFRRSHPKCDFPHQKIIVCIYMLSKYLESGQGCPWGEGGDVFSLMGGAA